MERSPKRGHEKSNFLTLTLDTRNFQDRQIYEKNKLWQNLGVPQWEFFSNEYAKVQTFWLLKLRTWHF